MKLGLYTIPHTGTRSIALFLRNCGIKFKQRHVNTPMTRPEWRRVLTVRHPHDCYLTHRRRYPSNTDVNFVAMWGHYIWRTQWMDAFYVALDCPRENRRMMMQELVQFCNGTPDFGVIDPFCEEWRKVGSTKERDEEFPEHMIEPLKFAVEWYEHYTVFWGARIRNSRNMLSEGP